jgi:hypothetical protein
MILTSTWNVQSLVGKYFQWTYWCPRSILSVTSCDFSVFLKCNSKDL